MNDHFVHVAVESLGNWEPFIWNLSAQWKKIVIEFVGTIFWRYMWTVLLHFPTKDFDYEWGESWERERERENGVCRSTGRITFIFFIAFIIALNIITGWW